MGCTLNFDLIREPDDEWRRMKKAWDACRAAGVEVPREVERFFDGSDPDPDGIKIPYKEARDIAVEFSNDWSEGYELDLVKLRERYPQIKKIKFYLSC